MGEFEKELEHLINRHSVENGSNTPDFILATYLRQCLEAFNAASRAREKWYGQELCIGAGVRPWRELAEHHGGDKPVDR